MSYLLDTHAVLWFFNGYKELPAAVVSLIEGRQSHLLVSHASLWEIAIKLSIGKLKLDLSFERLIDSIIEGGMELLPVSARELLAIAQLPLHHRDPFDRMLVAQAMSYDLTVITKDASIPLYAVKTYWQ